MKKWDWRILLTVALTFSSAAVIAHDYAKADLVVDHPWARPSLAATMPAAVYFDIVNNGAEGDRLLSAATARAEHVELHITEMTEEGIAKMRHLKDGIEAPAQVKTSMETGAYHIMLIGLDGPLKEGERFPMMLMFEKAGEVEVIVNVEDREKKGADKGAGAHAHH